jgi:hypothetical protein
MYTVELWFQKSPGIAGSDHREIRNLRFQVRHGSDVLRRPADVADGKVIFRAPAGESLVELLVGTRIVATYTVTVANGALPAADTTRGQQRRLRMLGYQLGHDGPFGDGVDGTLGRRTEGAILDYQADKGLDITGEAAANTQNALSADTAA